MRAPDASLRERIISTGGLLAVVGLVLLVLFLLFPRRELIAHLRAQPGNDALSISYLAQLLKSEPDNEELRLLLAERHQAAQQFERAEAVLAPLLTQASSQPMRQRARQLQLAVQRQQLAATPPGSAQVQPLREGVIRTLTAQLDGSWDRQQLLAFARAAVELDEPRLARRFYVRLEQGAVGGAMPWFDEAMRNAVATQDYEGAARLHRMAMQLAVSPAQQRQHLLEALRVLRAGNRLDDALRLAREHDTVVGNDGVLLRYLVELALAANRPALADPYAKRMLRMNRHEPRESAWLERLFDRLIPSAHAAEPPPGAAASPPLPASGEPQLPFDEAAYRLAFQTFLANRNVADAHRVASSAVRQMPEQVSWRERLAQVAEWNARPDEALVQWQWLAARARDPALVDTALLAVLRLAPGLNDDDALLDAWQRIGQRRRLSSAEGLDVAALYERLGRPEEALQWLSDRDLRDPAPVWLEARVDLLDRLGDPRATIAALEALIRRDGASTARALRLAGLHIGLGEAGPAYELLAPLADRTPEQDGDYWRILADLSWALQREPEAIRALQVRIRHGDYTADDADRLIALLRERQPAQAARLAEAAWRHLQRPDYLLLALELWSAQRDLVQLRRVFESVRPEDEAMLAAHGDGSEFWRQRALWHTASGNPSAALADMRRALASRPQDVELRSALIFMLIDAGEREELAGMVDDMALDARIDRELDAALAAAFQVLGQPQRALPYWRRQAAAHRSDVLWLFGYADALQAAGWSEAALAVQGEALRLVRSRPAEAPGGRPADPQAPAVALQVARLTLDRAPGDPSLAVLRELVRRVHGPAADAAGAAAVDPAVLAAADELMLSWLLSTEQFEPARSWLWQRYGRLLAAPPWAAMMLALHERDLEAVETLYTRQLAALPVNSRIDALAGLGRREEAHDLRVAELSHRDDDGLHSAVVDEGWARPRAVEWQVTQRRSGLRERIDTLLLRTPVDAANQVEVALHDASQASADLTVLRGVPAWTRSIDLTLRHALDASSAIDLRLGRHGAWLSTTSLALAVSARADAAVQLQAGVALNQPADETGALAVAGARHRVHLAADVFISPTQQARVELQGQAYRLQGGPRLGQGAGLDWTLTQWLRLSLPDLALRVFGNLRHYRSTDAVLPAQAVRLDPAGSVPAASFFMPGRYSVHGIGLSTGLSLQDTYSRAWRPFADVSLTYHDSLGRGHGASLGLSGSLLGGDHLSLFVRSLQAGAGGDEHEVGLRYALRF